MEIESAAERKARLKHRYSVKGTGRKHYFKDVWSRITLQQAESMILKCNNNRDRFLIATLFLTGARPIEITELRRFMVEFPENDTQFVIYMPKAKRQKTASADTPRRAIPIPYSAPFAMHVVDYVKSFENGFDWICPLSSARIRQIVYDVSDNLLCPYSFRHNRTTRWLDAGLTYSQVARLRGTSVQSIAHYDHVVVTRDVPYE